MKSQQFEDVSFCIVQWSLLCITVEVWAFSLVYLFYAEPRLHN